MMQNKIFPFGKHTHVWYPVAMKNKRSESDPDLKKFVETMRPMAKKLAVLQRTMKAAGMFIADRELLECSKCDLQEDVTFEGLLIVIKDGKHNLDTGLRFKELDRKNEWFECPSCKRRIKPIK